MVNHSQHGLHRPRATWTISFAGPTYKGYQTAKNKQNNDGMACKAKKFRAVCDKTAQNNTLSKALAFH